jgi:hypothetical protein
VPLVIRSVAVWLNVFIPWDVSGMTLTVPAGPHTGKTALDGAALLLTDQRAFSNDRWANSRMHSCVTIDVAGREPAVTVTHRCDGRSRVIPSGARSSVAPAPTPGG